jgi:hypothetical protein
MTTPRTPIKVSGYLASSIKAAGLKVGMSGTTGQIVITLKAGSMDALVAEVTRRGYQIASQTETTLTLS